MSSFTEIFRSWRRGFKARLPYVRRREYRIMQRKYADLIDALDLKATPAAQAKIYVAKPLQQGLVGEVCLFVSFADQPRLKPHVATHIRYLLDAGMRVVLILNTDLPAETFVFDNVLQERLSGVLIRENVGFDFAAWAHCWSLYKDKSRWSRLLLVNDSIVGPLGTSEFDRMLARMRSSEADVVGLTENLAPARHLQSYFLVFNSTALRSEVINHFFGRILNWPSKSQVIDVYETRMTGLLRAEGLCCEALFPALSEDPLSSNDISLRWAELIDAGFPYLKTMVISQDERARALLVSARVADSVKSDL